MRFLLLAAAFAVGAAGCGQKGPLYYRDNPPAGVKPPKTDTYEPVPYPKEDSKDARPRPAEKE
ncbi:MAG TPA: lipoprotein [Burkholderiales bacterium]|nr:lipoprotein [Burkholderiales bacterium]